MWNPWHGCTKISEGCANCYMYQQDEQYNVNSSIITKVKTKFDMPIKKDRNNQYKIKSGTVVATCFTSDFFIEEADDWRQEVWQMVKARPDLTFYIITKRIHRFMDCIPDDWGSGYDNVIINTTAENQNRLDERVPIITKLPIKHRGIVIAPILESIDMRNHLESGAIQEVSVGGESGRNSRICDYDWIMSIRNNCIDNNVNFMFYQTGTRFKKGGKLYFIKKSMEKEQALKANINFIK